MGLCCGKKSEETGNLISLLPVLQSNGWLGGHLTITTLFHFTENIVSWLLDDEVVEMIDYKLLFINAAV